MLKKINSAYRNVGTAMQKPNRTGVLEASTDGQSGAGFERTEVRSAAKLSAAARSSTSPMAAGAYALEISRSACLRVILHSR